MTKASVSPAKMKNLVAEYIINDTLPLSTVESPGFKKLIAEMTSSSAELPDRKALAIHLDKAYELMMSKIKGHWKQFAECQQQQMYGQVTTRVIEVRQSTGLMRAL